MRFQESLCFLFWSHDVGKNHLTCGTVALILTRKADHCADILGGELPVSIDQECSEVNTHVG